MHLLKDKTYEKVSLLKITSEVVYAKIKTNPERPRSGNVDPLWFIEAEADSWDNLFKELARQYWFSHPGATSFSPADKGEWKLIEKTELSTFDGKQLLEGREVKRVFDNSEIFDMFRSSSSFVHYEQKYNSFLSLKSCREGREGTSRVLGG